MRAAAAVLALTFPMWLQASCAAQQASDTDRDVLRTAVEWLRTHEETVPRLTVAGVFSAFPTQLKWELLDAMHKRRGAPLYPDPALRGDRAMVGLYLREDPDLESWEFEAQGLYRGPNNWVFPRFPAPAWSVADLSLRESGDRGVYRRLDLGSGTPSVTIKQPIDREATPRRRHHISELLGLLIQGKAPSALLGRPLEDPEWRLAPLAEERDFMEVRMALLNRERQRLYEDTFVLDEANGYAVVRCRRVSADVSTGEHGAAYEWRWADFRLVGDSDVALPWLMTYWEFSLSPEAGPPLEETQCFAAVELQPTSAQRAEWFAPRWALLDGPESDDALVTDPGLRDDAVAFRLQNFEEEVAPPPPQDLMELDNAAWAAEVVQRYGFE